MTTHQSEEGRSISRARGHLKQAEELHAEAAFEGRDFAVQKAMAQLAMGQIHATQRLAIAQETENLMRLYDMVEELDLDEGQWKYIDRKLIGRIAHSILDDDDAEVKLLQKIVHGEAAGE